MDRPYIERFQIENYGCVRNATFALTPLHALIGPNDSGKSTVLRALRTLVSGSRGELVRSVTHGQRTASLRVTVSEWMYEFKLNEDGKPSGAEHYIGTRQSEMTYSAPAYVEEATKRARLLRLDPTAKAMGVKLTDGSFVPAEHMSEGLLYYLAFATLPYLEPTPILLIEEPENGLHPARIVEVMRLLREISKTTQVLIATHSPLVINELQGDEVTVVTRTEQHGTRATLMKDTASFEERSKVYALGELWVSYANGEDEAPLLEGGPRP